MDGQQDLLSVIAYISFHSSQIRQLLLRGESFRGACLVLASARLGMSEITQGLLSDIRYISFGAPRGIFSVWQ